MSLLHLLPDGGEELGEGLGVGHALAGGGEDGVGEEGFLLLQAVDAVFDGVVAEEFMYEDWFGLANAVGAVCCLCFGGGIPPGIIVNDGVGGGKVEPGATGLEGDEKDGDVVVLKFVDESTAILRGAGEFEVGGLAGNELVLDKLEHGGELGEEKHAALFGKEDV